MIWCPVDKEFVKLIDLCCPVEPFGIWIVKVINFLITIKSEVEIFKKESESISMLNSRDSLLGAL